MRPAAQRAALALRATRLRRKRARQRVVAQSRPPQRTARRADSSASAACSAPSTPTTGPTTPASAQVSLRPARDVLEHAAQAGAAGRAGRERPAHPAHRAGLDDGHAGERAGVGDQELGGEVVGALDDQVVARDQRSSACPGAHGFHVQRLRSQLSAGAVARERALGGDVALERPTSSRSNRVCRCRFVSSTRSSSATRARPRRCAPARAPPGSRGRRRRRASTRLLRSDGRPCHQKYSSRLK